LHKLSKSGLIFWSIFSWQSIPWLIFLSVNALIEIDSRFIFREDKFQHQEHSFDFQFIVKGGSI